VSESNKRHCAGTVQSHGVGIRYVKQMCLETGPEDSHRRCRSDMFRQTVPDTSTLAWYQQKGTFSKGLIMSTVEQNSWNQRRWHEFDVVASDTLYAVNHRYTGVPWEMRCQHSPTPLILRSAAILSTQLLLQETNATVVRRIICAVTLQNFVSASVSLSKDISHKVLLSQILIIHVPVSFYEQFE